MSEAAISKGDATPPLVCLLAYDGLCTFEFGIGVEVFGLARPEFDAWYRFQTVAAESGPLRATGGITIATTHTLDTLKDADLILVPGWRGADVPVPKAVCDAIRAAHKRGARVASICSGVFVLAASGILNNRRATTHWRYVDALAEKYPMIDVDVDVLYVDDGDILTSAGSAAGLDLCLHIVRRDWGAAHANAVARRLVLHAHRDGGQRQFVQTPVPKERGGRLAPLLDTIRETIAQDWPVSRMAQVAGLSTRTLARRFQEHHGDTPRGWLTAARIANAADLLETTDASLSDIAAACGFGSSETFRREFRRLRGVAPSRYRTTIL